MDPKPARRAISAALSSNWEEAIKLNKEILDENPQDLDALMRSARAYYELGQIKSAIKMAEKVLEIDDLHRIANKCVIKWAQLNPDQIIPRIKNNNHNPSNVFLEEPGRTKMVSLVHLGDIKSITSIDCGDVALISASKHRVNITSGDGKYLGRLPDDVAMRLIEFINAGNDYVVYVKSISNNDLIVFIRETTRAETIAHLDSFSRF